MAGDPNSSAHPPLPPTTEDDRFLLLRLLRSRRVGVATFWRLLDEFGSASAALAALPGIAGAILLAASRAIGETMIVVLGAGAAGRLSLNPFEAMTTITAKIVS